MASKDKIQFRSLEELKDSSLTEKIAQNEFKEELPIDKFLGNEAAMFSTKTSRRDFLKFLGFSTAAVTLAACEAPVIKSVPYIVKPEGLIPGIPNYYASTFYNGYDFASVLVKTREGRPIKVESNTSAKLFSGTNARAQGSVLSLYDDNRAKKPKLNDKSIAWKDLDAWVSKGLAQVNAVGKRIVILTPSLPSPSTKGLMKEFKSAYPTTEWVVYDALSSSPALDAAQIVYGKRVIPMYDLSKTELLVSFGADFLNSWNSADLESSYAKAKTPGANMLKHIQVESNLSLTGASADKRIPLKPSEVQKLLAELYKAINGVSNNKIAVELAKALLAKGDKAVVFAEGDRNSYALAYLINEKLKSSAVSKNRVFLAKESNDARFTQFINWLQAGEVGALLNFNTNPVYSTTKSKELKALIQKVPFSISLSEYEDETSKLFKALAPVPNWLESWGDFNPATGVYLLTQPTIQRIYDTRQFQDSLLTWKPAAKVQVTAPSTKESEIDQKGILSDSLAIQPPPVTPPVMEVKSYYEYLKLYWTRNIVTKLGGSFNKALYSGYNESNEIENLYVVNSDGNSIVNNISSIKGGKFELQLYTKVGVGEGAQANNPWLQELPDPITRMAWDNYITISQEDAVKLGVINKTNGRMELDGSLVDLKVNGIIIKNIPILIQPGQAKGSIGLALGYGQEGRGKVGETGINAYPAYFNSNLSQYNADISITSKSLHQFASMQMQGTLMGRYEIARDVDLSTMLTKNRSEWNPILKMGTYSGSAQVGKIDLWRSFDTKDGHHFNLSVDLNACTGCGACIIACQAENNVPVVGKDEIRRSRDMYWLRIDRYYSSKKTITQKKEIIDKIGEVGMYKDLIQPEAENPDVIFQPVMCQHCNHAPCETVCPVAATSHGKQGQNHMAYNRCVGTRYCANNCPYKVRRFNWFNYALNDKFDYNMNSDLGRMVLNPDVVVRSRGVMEKCSMCIQMTQATILEAKKNGRRVKDEEFQVACSQACASGAIKFGDVNDSNSEVSKLSKSDRKYVLLEDIGTKPNVFYHVKVRNR